MLGIKCSLPQQSLHGCWKEAVQVNYVYVLNMYMYIHIYIYICVYIIYIHTHKGQKGGHQLAYASPQHHGIPKSHLDLHTNHDRAALKGFNLGFQN